MELKLYQVDAFTDRLFGGNPAAVMPLREELPEALMQSIASENNLSETAYLRPAGAAGEYHIRWFTPAAEINLCGHVTLASAWVVFNKLGDTSETLVFHSKSGPLRVQRAGDWIALDFPSWRPEPVEVPAGIAESLGGVKILEAHRYRDLLLLLEDEAAVRDCAPEFGALKKICDKLIITAKGSGETDFVSRFFAPGLGIDEDPVTDSAHSQLIPFWSRRLDKRQLNARQLSGRGGHLVCEQLNDERVLMKGQAVFYLEGTVYLP